MKHQKMNRILAAALSAACLVPFAAMVPVDADAADVMSALEITQEMGLGFNIGNSLDSTGYGNYDDITSFEKSWGNPAVTKEMVDTIKAKGFDSVRIPTSWFRHVTKTTDENGNPVYTIDSRWLERVKEVVDYAYQQGMYVILNLHHEEWINRSDFATAYDEMAPQLKQMWTQIATYFADYDQHLIFEGMNEPRAANSGALEWNGNEACYEVVNKLDNDFIETVRSVDSPYKDTRLLMIPGYAASAYSSIYGYLEIPEDDNYIAASVHAYCPYNFAMGDGDHMTFSDTNKTELDKIFKDIQTTFTNEDIPVVIGEFSASNYNNTEARVDWATYYLNWAKKLGIPCFLWDNNAINNGSNASESHGYLDRSSLQWFSASEPVIDAMLSVLDDSSVKWGSERHLPEYKHSDLSDATSVIYENAEGGKFLDDKGNDSAYFPAQMVSGSELSEDVEIAVQYTDIMKPDLNFMDKEWGNWTTVAAYDVDKEKGIAYFSYADIKKAWGDLSTLNSVCVGTGNSSSRIYKIALLPAAKLVDPTDPTDPTDPSETTIKGDINGDGALNVVDLIGMKRLFFNSNSATSLDVCDWNEDQTFDLMDVVGFSKFLIRKD